MTSFSRPTPHADIGDAFLKARRKRLDLTPYLFLAPYLLLFLVFVLIPGVVGVGISLTDWSILGQPNFIGIENFVTIFADPLFQQAMGNTFLFVVMTAAPLVVLGLLFALLLNQPLKGKTIVRTVIFAPYVVSVSAVGIIWTWLYQRDGGLINYYLRFLGAGQPIGWLTDVNVAMPALTITTVWWLVSINMIIYLAGLQDIPQELYEAANIDGAGNWQSFRFITLPMLRPVHAFVIPTTLIACWRVFGQAYVMTRGGPVGRTFVLTQYIYSTAFQNFKMGQAAAAGVILLIVTLIFTLATLRAIQVDAS